jgi:tetratricopeptide (TPR) repeat protein
MLLASMSKTTLVLGAVMVLTVTPAAESLRGERPGRQAAGNAEGSAAALETLRRDAEQARAAGRIDQAIDLYRRAVALQPAWVEGHWYLGTIYYDRDRHAECRDAFTRVLERQPENGAAWAFRGLCEFRLKQYEAALDHLNRTRQAGLGDDPAFEAVVAYHRAILLARFEQFERALDIHGNLVRGGNTTPTMLDALGIAMLRLPLLPDEVRSEQRDLIRLAGRAGAYGMTRMKEEARHAFEELVARYPDTPTVHFIYGNFLMAQERLDDALDQYRTEIQRSPGHVPARLQLAHELLKRGDFDAAGPYAAEAVRLAPDNYMARNLLGQVRLRAGDVEGAILELQTAATLEPTSPSVRFHLARAYQRAGRGADAAREREEFKRLERLQQVQRGAPTDAGPDGPEDTPRGQNPPRS